MCLLAEGYPQRLFKKALTYSRFTDSDNIFLSFAGVYSTHEHPFALVFELMDQLNLKTYLKNNQDIRRLKLVRFHRQVFCFPLSHHLDASC